MNELSQNSDNIIFLNFEDKETESRFSTWKKLLDHVEETRKDGLCYVLLDEIQAVGEWAEAVKTLRIRNCFQENLQTIFPEDLYPSVFIRLFTGN